MQAQNGMETGSMEFESAVAKTDNTYVTNDGESGGTEILDTVEPVYSTVYLFLGLIRMRIIYPVPTFGLHPMIHIRTLTSHPINREKGLTTSIIVLGNLSTLMS